MAQSHPIGGPQPGCHPSPSLCHPQGAWPGCPRGLGHYVPISRPTPVPSLTPGNEPGLDTQRAVGASAHRARRQLLLLGKRRPRMTTEPRLGQAGLGLRHQPGVCHAASLARETPRNRTSVLSAADPGREEKVPCCTEPTGPGFGGPAVLPALGPRSPAGAGGRALASCKGQRLACGASGPGAARPGWGWLLVQLCAWAAPRPGPGLSVPAKRAHGWAGLEAERPGSLKEATQHRLQAGHWGRWGTAGPGDHRPQLGHLKNV